MGSSELRDGSEGWGQMTIALDVEAARRASIVSVCDAHGITLDKQGSELFALCPFHKEKTPSFSVSPEKGQYFCFGCDEGGGIRRLRELQRGR